MKNGSMERILIIAEKPSVALRLAIALGDGKQKRINRAGAGYFEIDSEKAILYIAPAVGHVFTLAQKVNKSGYPVLDVEWKASYEVNPKSDYTKKYLDIFIELGRTATEFVNACDFDTEGTVIGTNIMKFISKDWANKGRRMKFSTTTIPDLKNSFSNLMPLDVNNFYAGEARHTLDWLWGINLSRALSSAVSGPHSKPLSIGRVQGPTLAIVAKREKEISQFVPQPYWKISIDAKGAQFDNVRGNISDKIIAQQAFERTKANMHEATVEKIELNEQQMRPYPPFDLTSLQLEASRALRYDPSSTLALAQSLYEKSYISYPRTSSQKLPSTLGLPKIIEELSKNPQYAQDAGRLISERRFRPNEGAKSDEAHPAIYPTGITPKSMSPTESRLYDLITRRFLACFAPYSKIAKGKVIIRIKDELYSANGTSIIERGWMDFYKYANIQEKSLPDFSDKQVSAQNLKMDEQMTLPPKRYSKAMLLSDLEKRELGTKATRAAVIDTLFKRGYIDGSPIKVTEFGMSVYDALVSNAGMIVEEETTRKLEKDMEEIVLGKKSEQEVIDEGKKMLLEALRVFDSNKQKISSQMQKGLEISVDILGKCLKDGGDLIIRHSRAGKQFVACSKYPDCTMTYSIPQNAKIVATGKICEYCKTPIVKVIRRGKGVFEIDLDPNCKTKDKWRAKQQAKTDAQSVNITKQAPIKTKPEQIVQKPKDAQISIGAVSIDLSGPAKKAASSKKKTGVVKKSIRPKKRNKSSKKV